MLLLVLVIFLDQGVVIITFPLMNVLASYSITVSHFRQRGATRGISLAPYPAFGGQGPRIAHRVHRYPCTGARELAPVESLVVAKLGLLRCSILSFAVLLRLGHSQHTLVSGGALARN